MPRSRRQDFPGAWHHVINRGARRNPVFFKDTHCHRFLDLLGEAVDRYGLEVHAYSLMPNHYHLLVRTPEANLSRCMRHINGVYTQWFNHAHGWEGPLFRGRYKSQLVLDEGYLRFLLAYIHLNPLRAGLIHRMDADAWTSHRVYLGRDSRPAWLTTGVMLELLGGRAGLVQFIRSVRVKAVEYPDDLDPQTGLFRRRGLSRSSRLASARGRASPDPDKARSVERVLARIGRLCGVSLAEIRSLALGPAANPARRFAIWALHRGAGLSHREIGAVLDVSPHQVASLLSRLRRGGARQPLRGWMDAWLAGEGSPAGDR